MTWARTDGVLDLERGRGVDPFRIQFELNVTGVQAPANDHRRQSISKCELQKYKPFSLEADYLFKGCCLLWNNLPIRL